MLKFVIAIPVIFMLFSCASSEAELENKLADSSRNAGFTSTLQVILQGSDLKNSDAQPVLTKLQFKQLALSEILIERTLHTLGSERGAKEVKTSITIEGVRNTDILTLSLSDQDSLLSLSFLDAHVETICDSVKNYRMQPINSKIEQVNHSLDSLAVIFEDTDNRRLSANSEKQYVKLLEDKVALTIEKAGFWCEIRILSPLQLVKNKP